VIAAPLNLARPGRAIQQRRMIKSISGWIAAAELISMDDETHRASLLDLVS